MLQLFSTKNVSIVADAPLLFWVALLHGLDLYMLVIFVIFTMSEISSASMLDHSTIAQRLVKISNLKMRTCGCVHLLHFEHLVIDSICLLTYTIACRLTIRCEKKQRKYCCTKHGLPGVFALLYMDFAGIRVYLSHSIVYHYCI